MVGVVCGSKSASGRVGRETETSSVVQHSIACPKSLLSAFLSRWMDAWLSKASWCRTTVDDVEVTALRECAAESPVPTSQ